MGDADILVRQEQYDRIIPIIQKMGFEIAEECDHVYAWKSKALFLELHVKLIPSSEKAMFDYFGDGWKFAKQKDAYHYEMTVEDEFIFVFSHFVKHYRDSGIGCRHVTDLWILNRLLDDDKRKYIAGELKKLRLDRFYENMLKVIKNWFENGEADDITEHITQFIFSSGNWGSANTHALACEMLNSDTSDPEKVRTKMLLKDIFPPVERIKGEYPILERLPFILPFVWIWRLIKTVIFRRNSVRRSIKRASLLDKDSVSDFKQNLEMVGLEVNTKSERK